MIITAILDQEEDIRSYQTTLEGLRTPERWRGIYFPLALAMPDLLLRKP